MAACWQPTGLFTAVGPLLGLYYGGCWTAFRTVCWQPTGLMWTVGPLLGLYVGNLQALWELLNRFYGCILATYRLYEGCWTAFMAVCWQPTGLITAVGPLLGLYVGNLQALWGLLDRFYRCMLATYRPSEGCWTAFMAVCWQSTCLMTAVEALLGLYVGNLYVGNLQALWGLLDRF